MRKKNIDISKFLSYVLRHQPEAIGLSLGNEGWAIISDLILCSVKEGYTLDNNLLRNIVDSSDKKRRQIFYIMEQRAALYLQSGSKV